MQTVVQRIEALPEEFDALERAGTEEGFAFLARIRTGWTAAKNRFDLPGEALWEARHDGALVGICGLNRDPYLESADVGRVRHLYVLPAARRRGVAARLVEVLVQHAEGRFGRLRVRTNTEAGDDFYRAIGFVRTEGEAEATHAWPA